MGPGYMCLSFPSHSFLSHRTEKISDAMMITLLLEFSDILWLKNSIVLHI